MKDSKLGRLTKDKSLYKYQNLMERSEAGKRNAIEGKFAEAKRCDGFDCVMARLTDTNNTAIHLNILIMYLKKRLRDLYEFNFHLPDCFSSAGLVFKVAVQR